MKSDNEVTWFGDSKGKLSRDELLWARTLTWLISYLDNSCLETCLTSSGRMFTVVSFAEWPAHPPRCFPTASQVKS